MTKDKPRYVLAPTPVQATVTFFPYQAGFSEPKHGINCLLALANNKLTYGCLRIYADGYREWADPSGRAIGDQVLGYAYKPAFPYPSKELPNVPQRPMDEAASQRS